MKKLNEPLKLSSPSTQKPNTIKLLPYFREGGFNSKKGIEDERVKIQFFIAHFK